MAQPCLPLFCKRPRLGVSKKVLVQLPLVLSSSVSDIFKDPSIRTVICDGHSNDANLGRWATKFR
jgi:hypothetical protein